MKGFLLQDWVSLKFASGVLTITQTEREWLNTEAYQDLVFWLDVRQTALGGATSLTLDYETSPLRDDSLFRPMRTGTTITTSSTIPIVTPVLMTAAATTYPIANWFRWKLTVVGTGTPELTFRLSCAANKVGP